MKASICVLSWNRTEIAKRSITHNLKAGDFNHHDYELLICDQGTNDPEYIEWLKSLNPTYLRLNKSNEGVARSLNQLIARAKGDHVWLMPTDAIMPENWLSLSINYADNIPNLGILSIKGQDGATLPEAEIMGLNNQTYELAFNKFDGYLDDDLCVYGPILITRNLINKIGGYCESYHPYGLEDADLCFRCHISSLICGYIPGLKYEHIDNMFEAKDETGIAYRARKEYAFGANVGLHKWRARNYHRIGVYEPLPILREPLD